MPPISFFRLFLAVTAPTLNWFRKLRIFLLTSSSVISLTVLAACSHEPSLPQAEFQLGSQPNPVAEPTSSNAPPLSSEVFSSQESFGTRLETSATSGKDLISKTVRSFSSEIDAFFSSRRTSYLTNKSQLRVSYITTVREFEGVTGNGHFTFNLLLPETQRRAQLVVERKPRGIETPDEPGEVGPAKSLLDERQSQTAASLRYFLLDSLHTSISSDVGLQLDYPIQPFGRFRIVQSFFPSRAWELRATEEVYFFFVDRWKLVTLFDSDWKLTDDLLFRLGNDLTWYQLKNEFDFLYGPSLFQKLSKKSALGYHAKLLAKNIPNWQNIDLNLSVVYRQQIFREWFYYELIPGVDLPRSMDWHATPAFSVKVEAIF